MKLDFGLYTATLSEEAKKAWPYDFGLVYSVTLGKDGLQTMLNVRNEGKEAFEFQMLLHSYFRVKVSYILETTCSDTPTVKLTEHLSGCLQSHSQRSYRRDLRRQSPRCQNIHRI